MDLRSSNSQSQPSSANRYYDEVPALHHAGVMQPSLASKVLVILLIVVSILVIGFMGTQLLGNSKAESTVKTNEYQALFLTNGQVYFCHLSQVDSGYVKCNDIYYLQVQQA